MLSSSLELVSIFATADSISLYLLILGEGGVDGSIPSEIGILTSLTNIDFGKFSFYSVDVIEDKLWTPLIKIAVLLCKALNVIDGRLPSEIGYLTLLDGLNFCECCKMVSAVDFLFICCTNISSFLTKSDLSIQSMKIIMKWTARF